MRTNALTSRLSSRARLLTALVFAPLFVASSACSVIVAGKLDEKTAVDDAGSGTCTPAAACSDGNACNGADTCSATGECTPGTTMVADGTVCDLDGAAGAGICSARVCAMPRCGDRLVTGSEACDDGANDDDDNDNDGCKNDCKFTCQRDEDCGDGNLCDGSESCLPGLPGMRVCRESIAIPPNGTTCVKPGGETGSCMAGLCM